MINNKKILAVTPARGGSKGILRKNIKEINGKPLIAWTIEAAKKSKLLDRYIVSTEDEEISGIAQKYGAEVLKRPKVLAKDNVITLSVLQHALKKIDADVIVLLYPTSPVREEGLIDKCIERFIKKDADVIATGFICKLYEWGKYNKPRQSLEGWFHDDGNVYVIKADLIRRGKMLGKKLERVIVSREQNIEIDDEFDFWINEQILAKKNEHNV